MTTFDHVLPELIRICREDSATRDKILRYCVVRDVRGRVRLIVEPEATTVSIKPLEITLHTALGKYFVPPVLTTKSSGNEQRLAAALFERANCQWPRGWPSSYRNVLGGGDTPIAVGTQWSGIERTIGKEAWLTSDPPTPPWPLLNKQTPPIITFHSFKGGVGRTTLVSTYAIRLASETPPRRVAIIDLDLEAPGVGSLFGVNSDRGVIDVLVDHIATGQIDLEGASMQAQLEGDIGQHITVFSAGRVDNSYIQKLARLDFSSTEPGENNPVSAALTAMLKKIKASHDVVLLDARAGLHDLAGMSLHGLAHVDVLVFRATTQNLEGLAETLRTIGDRDSNPKLVLIETMLPNKDDEFESHRQRTRDRVYELLVKHVYSDDDPPQLSDVGEPHDVVSVRRRDWLDGIDSFRDRIQNTLNDSELRDAAMRIDEACTRDSENEE
jgi:MinD-like ATPase involved in chromosome partitioning or flagellar assembly